jgi:hypothetical protein
LTACFSTFAPKIYEEYSTTLQQLYENQPHLKQNFPSSIFPAATFNLGPNSMCFLHRDVRNVPYGFCAITSAGSYDPEVGGHLVLWELGLVVEFPPGSTILIPSATISHCNTSIQPGETRYSMTQYCAGGLFRWVEFGFRTKKSLEKTAAGWVQIAQANAMNGFRRERVLSLFSRHEELIMDHKGVGSL